MTRPLEEEEQEEDSRGGVSATALVVSITRSADMTELAEKPCLTITGYLEEESRAVPFACTSEYTYYQHQAGTWRGPKPVSCDLVSLV